MALVERKDHRGFAGVIGKEPGRSGDGKRVCKKGMVGKKGLAERVAFHCL